LKPIVCFTSDFGQGDTWVGVVHAVMLEDRSELRVVNISHEIPPFDIRSGSIVASSGVVQLPGLVHLVVVDPGVGGPRRDVVLSTGDGTVLVGPDNGVLMPAARRAGGVTAAVALDPGRVGRPDPLPTFHARDVLAPAAAEIAMGADPRSFGDPIEVESLAESPFPPARVEGEWVVGEVLDFDRFGSMRLSITPEDLDGGLEPGGMVGISSGHTTLHIPFGRTFADVPEGDPVALFDSSGWLTVAVNGESASERYGFDPGHSVRVRSGA
jgi:S-adenosylmethionine hydrolase